MTALAPPPAAARAGGTALRFAYATTSRGLPIAVQRRVSPVATVVCCIRAGARHDSPSRSGMTHLLEHTLLLDSPGRPSFARVIEELGGESNGYTGKEEMFLYCRVPARDLERGLGLLADCVMAPPPPLELIERERAVVVEELRAAASDPASVIHDVLYQALFDRHGLANPLGGDAARVQRVEPEEVVHFRNERVHARTVALVVIGDAEPDSVVGPIERSALGGLECGEWRPEDTAAPDAGAACTRHRHVVSDYVYGAVAVGGFAYAHPLRAAADVLAMLIGGCTGSLLYRELRSERGLAYVVDCWHRCYRDAGAFRSVFAVGPENVEAATGVARSVLEAAFERRWSSDEIECAQRQCVAQLSLEWESPVEHAIRLSRHAFVASLEGWQPGTYIRSVEAVGPEELAAVGRELAARPMTTALAGPVAVGES